MVLPQDVCKGARKRQALAHTQRPRNLQAHASCNLSRVGYKVHPNLHAHASCTVSLETIGFRISQGVREQEGKCTSTQYHSMLTSGRAMRSPSNQHTRLCGSKIGGRTTAHSPCAAAQHGDTIYYVWCWNQDTATALGVVHNAPRETSPHSTGSPRPGP